MNKHFRSAELIAGYSGTQVVNEQQKMSLQEAQVQATLALAYEQRTANLIAAFREDELDDTGTSCIDFRALADQITERLDLA